MTTRDDKNTGVTTKQRAAGAPKTEAVFCVRVEQGADRGQSVLVDGHSEILVGQSPVCGLRLSDPEVSRRHLALDSVDGTLRVRDLGSTNGTFCGGVEVREVRVREAATLRLGQTTLSIRPEGSREVDPRPQASFGALLGDSRAVRRLFPVLERLARSPFPVLIEGETGTGKEVTARALHEQSPRRGAPFVVFDCAAVAPNLIESELFGHEKGAFTGAAGARKGVFEQAHRGTLFLDELGDLPLDLQSKLLRAIERGEVRRLGGSAWVQCDVRVVAATRRDMDRLVQEGRFRDDLFHRLAVGRVELPPLRERPEDIEQLARHFAREADPEAPPIPRSVLGAWLQRPWPGNVRELRNAVFRYLALGDLLPAADAPAETLALPLPAPVAPAAQGESEIDALLRLRLPYGEARDRLQQTFERRYVEQTLAAAGGSVPRAAKLAGITVRYFQLLRARSGG